MFWLGLATAIAYIPGYTGAAIPTGWAVLALFLPSLALWRHGEVTVLHWALFAFLAYAVLALTWDVGYNGPWRLWLLGIFAMAFWLGSTDPNIKSVYQGLAVGLGLSSLVALGQAFGWHAIPSFGPTPSGLLFNPTALGASAAVVIVGLVLYRQWAYIPALLPGLYLSHSRGAAAVLAIGLLSLIRKPLLILVACSAAAFALTYHPVPSDYARMSLWRAAWSYSTLFGNGPGSWLDLYIFQDASPTHPEFVHNDYLELWFEYGVGAIPLFGLLAIAATGSNAKEWPVFISLATLALFYFPLSIPVLALVLGLSAGSVVGDLGLTWACRHRRGLAFLSRLHEPRRTGLPVESNT